MHQNISIETVLKTKASEALKDKMKDDDLTEDKNLEDLINDAGNPEDNRENI